MSLIQNGKTLPGKISDKILAAMIANILRTEHADSSSAVKHIGRITGANLHSIAKWYKGQNAPKSAHLLMLAQAYPSVLDILLQLTGKKELLDTLADIKNSPNSQISSSKNQASTRTYRVKFVSINVVVDSKIAIKLNHRQLWFLGELQNNKKVNSYDIEKVWNVSKKTSKRDISDLCRNYLIKFLGAKKNGYYIVI